MRVLFLGDVVGPPGVEMIRQALPLLLERERYDLVIANAENASNGSGITPKLFKVLRNAGIDAMTLGDHIYRRAEIISVLEKDDRVCKPANFPAAAPGRDYVLVPTRTGDLVGLFSVLGRTYMRSVDCPFQAADRVLEILRPQTSLILADIHAEATADKYLFAHHVKGRVSAVFGTHTHIATADEQIFPGGTAYITDVGMCGPYDSILGRRVDRVLSTTIDFVPTSFEVAYHDVRLAGAVVEIDPTNGHATSIRRFLLDEKGFAEMQPKS